MFQRQIGAQLQRPDPPNNHYKKKVCSKNNGKTNNRTGISNSTDGKNGGQIKFSVRLSRHSYTDPCNNNNNLTRGNTNYYLFVEIERCFNLCTSSTKHNKTMLMKDILYNLISTSAKRKSSNESHPSPYVMIKWRNNQSQEEILVGCTPILNKMCDPIWHDECYEFPLGDSNGTLRLEVWNQQSVENNEMIGLITLNLSTTLILQDDDEVDQGCELNEFTMDLKTKLEEQQTIDSRLLQTTQHKHETLSHNKRNIFPGPQRSRVTNWFQTTFMFKSPTTKMNHSKISPTPKQNYKIINPDPYRRINDIRLKSTEYLGDESSSNSTFRALMLILAYVLLGVIGFSFVFEDWDIRDSLYFSVTTFTTVGYGDVYPTSDAGKLFSCFFALLGMGIIGIALGYIGQNLIQAQMNAMQKTQQKIEQKKERRASSIRQRRSTREEIHEYSLEDGEDSKEMSQSNKSFGDILINKNNRNGSNSLHATNNNTSLWCLQWTFIRQILMIQMPILIMVSLGSLVVGLYENWNWIDAIYWCVITGTSVGIGDIVPTTNQMKWFCIFFIPISVGIISSALGRIANIFIEREIAIANAKLLKSELTLEDLEKMNVDGDEEVTQSEFVEYMLLHMNKVDKSLLDDLHHQFHLLDADGSGGLQKEDLDLLKQRKLEEEREIAISSYKNTFLMRKASFRHQET